MNLIDVDAGNSAPGGWIVRAAKYEWPQLPHYQRAKQARSFCTQGALIEADEHNFTFGKQLIQLKVWSGLTKYGSHMWAHY